MSNVEAFQEAINRCSGSVWLEDKTNGDKLDLKSTFSQYLAIGRLIEDQNENLELFARNREDEQIILEFFDTYEHAM